MRIAIAFVAVLTLALAASANPVAWEPSIFFDFDEDGVPDGDIQLEVYLPPYTTVSAYVAMGCQNDDWERFTTVSFRIEPPTVTCPGIMATQSFTSMLPGGLTIGDPFVGGITCAATECMTDRIVYIGRLDMFYLGGECLLQIVDHSQYPRWVVDCQEPGEVTEWCTYAWGGVGRAHLVVDDWCYPPPSCPMTPVENVSWGAVKAMFR